MPKTIYYVGVKTREAGGETAFMSETQIRWFPGDSNAVPDNVASRMLAHPDVFSDKSPEERAELERQAREAAAAALQRPQGGGGAAPSLEAFLSALPKGTKIVMPNGMQLEMPGAGAAAEGDDDNTQFRAGAPSLAGAHASGLAQRLSAATGIDGALDGNTAMLQETQVSGATDASAISLAPGATVASAPAPTSAPAPAPTPAPTAAPAANTAKAQTQQSTKGKAK